MKRLTNEEKRQLGTIIHYYRNQYFRSETKNKDEFKQVNFCKDICSQTQLSRLEHGEPLRNQGIYENLLNKLNLQLEKVTTKDYLIFSTYFENILTYQNDDQLVINSNEYVYLINKYQNIFKRNIICTHYNYALEFILAILNDDIEEATYLTDYVENTLDLLPPNYLVVTLHYLGIYYYIQNNNNKANKFYLFSIEHMHKFTLKNPIIYIEIAYNYLSMNKSIYALDHLNKALEAFTDTHNYVILERIYRCFGMIYVKNNYYNDGFNMLMNALQFAEKTNKIDIQIKDYSLLAIVFYFKKEYIKALEFIESAIKIKHSDLVDLIRKIIERKLDKDNLNVQYENKLDQLILNFYQEEMNEVTFEKLIEPNINQIHYVIKLLILHDVYLLYKENKKYKKALELIEHYYL